MKNIKEWFWNASTDNSEKNPTDEIIEEFMESSLSEVNEDIPSENALPRISETNENNCWGNFSERIDQYSEESVEEQIAHQKFLAKYLSIVGAVSCVIIMPASIGLIVIGAVYFHNNKDDVIFPVISASVGFLSGIVGGLLCCMSFSTCIDKPEDYINKETVTLTGVDNLETEFSQL